MCQNHTRHWEYSDGKRADVIFAFLEPTFQLREGNRGSDSEKNDYNVIGVIRGEQCYRYLLTGNLV